MVDKKIIHEWLDKADEDYGFAATSLKDEVGYFPQICFHFQQAAEKYLKAFIVANELKLRKIHNLQMLLKICCGCDESLSDLKDECVTLDQFYVETRYPVHWPTKFTKSDALEARDASFSIGNRVKDILCLNK